VVEKAELKTAQQIAEMKAAGQLKDAQAPTP